MISFSDFLLVVCVSLFGRVSGGLCRLRGLCFGHGRGVLFLNQYVVGGDFAAAEPAGPAEASGAAERDAGHLYIPQQQAQLLTFFVNPPITLLSGATSPLENMPEFFQKLSYLDPLRYLVTIVRGVTLKDAPWSALWPNLLALAGFAILLFAISAWRFRKV